MGIHRIILLFSLPVIIRSMVIHGDFQDNNTKELTGESSLVTSMSTSDGNWHTNFLTSNGDEVTKEDAQASTNWFTDMGAPYSSRAFDSSQDYGSLFDFPSLPYFPDFGEIFRIQRTTTPQPPFRFPDYVREPFAERPPESSSKASYGKTESAKIISGGRRPSRRPPRPASSGTKTKVAKQNQSESKEKPKTGKTKPPNKARDYPKIFRFNSDRVNLADFDMRKKMNGNYVTLSKGDDLDSNKIKRNKFLILHGGVFEITNSVSSSRDIFVSSSDNKPVTTSLDNA